jgi:hypothetical protein
MQMTQFLRVVLLVDAVATAATGSLMVLASGALEAWLNLPAPLLFYAGLALLPYAVFVGYVAKQPFVSRSIVWAIIGCNAVWAVDSVLLLTTGWLSPSALGYAFVITQAVVVAALCELQFMALRRVRVVAGEG